MTSSWRVAVVTRILPVALGFVETVRAAGHEPVALLSIRDTENRYGTEFTLDALLNGVPPELDVLLPARRSSIAPLLASVAPDLVVCMGFPWKIPADALAVPTLGWLNGHPSQLPRHRGPIPVAWAIRHGDPEVGLTFHRMDAELDTGPIMAQAAMEFGEYAEPDVFYPRMGQLMMGLLGESLAKLESGEEGTVQEGGEVRVVLHRRRCVARLLAPCGRAAPARVGLAVCDFARRAARRARRARRRDRAGARIVATGG